MLLVEISQRVVKLDHLTKEEIAETIIKDCHQYLNEIKNQPTHHILYRGANTKNFFEKRKRFKDRSPLSTKLYYHETFNRYFEKYFLWKARNGVFATGSILEALEYTDDDYTAHIFFPIGRYKYVWSEKVVDLYYEITHKIEPYYEELLQQHGDDLKTIKRELEQYIEYYVKTYKDDDLVSGIKSGHEISFDVNEYYLLKNDQRGKLILKIIENKLS